MSVATQAESLDPDKAVARPSAGIRGPIAFLERLILKPARWARRYYRRALGKILDPGWLSLQIEIDRESEAIRQHIRERDPDAIALAGFKVYSQFDEDGIIEEIFCRIGEKSRLFVEIGCGNGLENNTHYLLLKGWKGLWVDAEPDNIRFIKSAVEFTQNDTISVECARVGRENINRIMRSGLGRLGVEAWPADIDFFSLDIDGNDLEVLAAVTDLAPRVICVEYNAKFPPPLRLSVAYEEERVWTGNDYQGASLQCFVDLLEMRGYTLVSCSLSGVNAFFVRNNELNGLSGKKVCELYQPARYYLTQKTSGHPPSLLFLKNRIRRGTSRDVGD